MIDPFLKCYLFRVWAVAHVYLLEDFFQKHSHIAESALRGNGIICHAFAWVVAGIWVGKGMDGITEKHHLPVDAGFSH
jgi:hypothetical protein